MGVIEIHLPKFKPARDKAVELLKKAGIQVTQKPISWDGAFLQIRGSRYTLTKGILR